MYKGHLYKSCQPCPWGRYRPCHRDIIICHRLIMEIHEKSATGLNIYDSKKIGPQRFICPDPVAIYMYMYITTIFNHLRNRLANQSQILYEAFLGRGNQCVHENSGHMTKMATMPIHVYGKPLSYFPFVHLLYLLTLR